MSRKLTDEELREPDITVLIPEDIWKALPNSIQLTLKHFDGKRMKNIDTGQRAIKYVLPAYLARQLEQEAEAITSHQEAQDG